MKKKVVSKVVAIVVCMFVISLLISKLYDIGLHRPALAYRDLSPISLEWANSVGHSNPNDIIHTASMGPFNWDNKDDLGRTLVMGPWELCEDANVVVYYRKDKNASGQLYARDVMQCAEDVIMEIGNLWGIYRYPLDLNNRKLTFYLPESDDDYQLLLSKLSKDAYGTSVGYGSSIIELGPLGCKNCGIVLHPKGFKEYNEDGDCKFVSVIRKEVAHYVYLSNLDYNKDINQFTWFVDGLAEYFSMLKSTPQPLSKEMLDAIQNQCFLTQEFPLHDRIAQIAGASFFKFYDDTFGGQQFQDLITLSCAIPSDSLFEAMNQDPEALKQQWLGSICVMPADTDSIPMVVFEDDIMY